VAAPVYRLIKIKRRVDQRAIGVQLHILRASTDEEIELAFASITQLHLPAFAVASDPFLTIVALHRCKAT
jgi:hypothetical protein